MSVRGGQAVTVEFTTSNPTTQAAVNADSLPTGKLVVTGVDNAATVTITNVDTGRYKAAVTLPALGLTDVVELVISATVATIAGKAVVWRDTVATLLSWTVWEEVLTSFTHNTTSSAGKILRSINPNSGAIYASTAPSQAGMTSTQIKLDAGASAVDGTYNFNVVSITGGTDVGDSRIITGYVGATRVATVSAPWTVQPDATSTFEITPTAATQVVSYIAGQDPATLVWAAAARTLTALPAISTDWLSAAGVSAAAVAKIQAGLSTYAGGPVASVTSTVNATLVATGLDAIPITAPTGPATTFRQMVVQTWRRLFKASAKDATAHTLKTFADDGTTVISTQSYTDDGLGNETLGGAS